jgi:dienelactone hydrolase
MSFGSRSKWLFIALFAISIVVLCGLYYYEIIVPRKPINKFLSEMESRVQIYKPQHSSEPNSVAIMFHGCGGTFNHQEIWAKHLNDNGYYAVVVDSFKDRELDPGRVCAGESFRGYRRASDVISALSIVKSKLGHLDNIFLIGWSHGAWSAIEAISYLNDSKVTGGIKDLPANVSSNDLTGAILFYPFCKEGFNYNPQNGWNMSHPPLFIFAENDTTVDNAACQTFIENNLQQHNSFTMPDVDHAFDYPEGLEKYKIFPNPSARDQSKDLVLDYLNSASTIN